MADSVVDLTKTYDAVVIGSGAAGGMACHVLTSRGAKVLLLEAGKKLEPFLEVSERLIISKRCDHCF